MQTETSISQGNPAIIFQAEKFWNKGKSKSEQSFPVETRDCPYCAGVIAFQDFSHYGFEWIECPFCKNELERKLL